ncbi:hypothetical protein GCK72_004169 [Caenorhabditis remanei]|uniref:F-box domain-containing protein n=1 Tax=Caenorhabditis remanei TaxID=31234 RepID=A0A6A5HCW7_CAERE|nr:hypothetical protein GCK72_004169 [Caenorhabditis remanei]KAF1764222.1 hypothetical protein GCK72_004169 [Caenorhabditis remanei]
MYRICSQMLCLKWFKSPFMSDNKVSIMDMPDLVMRKIMGHVGFITIMKLRKVCHAFRNFIDDSKVNYGLTRVNFIVRPSLISVMIYWSSADRILLHYVKYVTSSLVKVNGSARVTILKNEDFLDVFSRDLRAILRNQRLPSMILEIKEENFEIVGAMFYKKSLNKIFTSISNKNNGWCCRRNLFNSPCEFADHLRDVNGEPFLKPFVDKFYDCFKNVLKSRGSPIQIEELDIEVMESSHFMDIPCFIDIKYMKSLEIYRYKDEEQSLDEIVELDGWECIQELSIKNFKVTIPLERFLHKSQLNIRIPTISMEDVLFLKMRLLTSPVFEDYTIFYDNLKDMDRLISVLGRFQVDDDQEKHCIMYRSICSQILCLKWFKSPPEEVTDNEVSIMDMPDLVMRKIMGHAGFLSISLKAKELSCELIVCNNYSIQLRKVCHAFRNFIDDTKLDYGFTRVNVVVRPFLIRVIIVLSSSDLIDLIYAKYGTDSLVNWKVNGLDRELYIEVMESRHFMDIARFIDIKHMKCLDVVCLNQPGFKKEQQFLDEIVELDDWECIQELTIRNFNINIPLERFLHKSHLNIRIPTISMEDVLFLKMRLLTSPVFEDYTIYYDDLKDMDRLSSVLGRFEIDAVKTKHWYFRIPGTKQVLDIGHQRCYDYFRFFFLRKEISYVPKYAIV